MKKKTEKNRTKGICKRSTNPNIYNKVKKTSLAAQFGIPAAMFAYWLLG